MPSGFVLVGHKKKIIIIIVNPPHGVWRNIKFTVCLFLFFWGRAPLRWCNHPISMKCCTVVCPCVGCVFSTFGGHILRGLQISDPKGAWGRNLGLSESHKPFDREFLENGSHRVTCQLGLNISSKDLSNMYDWAVAPRKVKVKVWTLVVVPLT